MLKKLNIFGMIRQKKVLKNLIQTQNLRINIINVQQFKKEHPIL